MYYSINRNIMHTLSVRLCVCAFTMLMIRGMSRNAILVQSRTEWKWPLRRHNLQWFISNFIPKKYQIFRYETVEKIQFWNQVWDEPMTSFRWKGRTMYHIPEINDDLRVWGTIQRRIFVEKTDFTISEIQRSMFTFRIRNLNHMFLSGLEYRLAQKMARQLIWVEQ